MFIVIISLGLLIGSFINAVVWRLREKAIQKSKIKNQKLSILTGRSMCPDCGHQLAAIDLVPVLSWLWLRGKCRYCSKPISAQYPIVELLTAVLFGLSYYNLQPTTYNLILWLYFLTVLIILSVYDLRWYLLPDKVLLPAIVVAFVNVLIAFALVPSARSLTPVLAALAAGGAFYAIAAVSGGKWMGGGDIKLVFFMGLILGPANMAVALLIAFNTAALVGVMLIVSKIKKRTDHIPFGPFLAAGTVVAMLYGQTIVSWYLQGLGFG